MKIAISAAGPTLESEVDPRFGRCQYFIIANPETMEFETIENFNVMAAGGAGISTAQMIAGKGVETVLTGNCGPNAYQVLSTAGIKIFTGNSGTIRDAIQSYKSGQLQATSYPTVRGHHAGTGKGMGRDTGASVTSGVTPVSSPEDPAAELSSVRAELQKLNDKLIEVQCRLEMLEKK